MARMKRTNHSNAQTVGETTRLSAFRLSHECLALLEALAKQAGQGTGRPASRVSVLEKAVRFYAKKLGVSHAGQ